MICWEHKVTKIQPKRNIFRCLSVAVLWFTTCYCSHRSKTENTAESEWTTQDMPVVRTSWVSGAWITTATAKCSERCEPECLKSSTAEPLRMVVGACPHRTWRRQQDSFHRGLCGHDFKKTVGTCGWLTQAVRLLGGRVTKIQTAGFEKYIGHSLSLWLGAANSLPHPVHFQAGWAYEGFPLRRGCRK